MKTVAVRQVPLLDLKAQHIQIREEALAAVVRVIDSQKFIMGEEVQALEREIAAYSNTKFAIGCASGSDALLLALMAAEIGHGDRVITTPFTFFATAGAISRLGAIPVFVDVDANTFNLNPALIQQVHRNDGSDPFVSFEGLLYECRIQIECVGIYVHKYRDGAEPADRTRGREECERRGNHAISVPDLGCH